MSTRLTRRNALRHALFGAGGIGLGALATGLPVSFLLDRRAAEAQADALPTYTILSTSGSGHPINANTPGTYARNPGDGSDPISLIEHARVSELGSAPLGTIGGEPYGAADFETPVNLRLGASSYKAAGVWGALDASLRQRMAFFHHATYANAHPEFGNVMKFHGGIKARVGSGGEMLASFLAQETAVPLHTLTDKPVNVGGTLTTIDGRPLSTLNPPELRSLFAATTHPTGVPDPSEIVRLRDSLLDEIYADVRVNGSYAQRAFLDRYAISRSQAAELGASLGPLLTDVSGNTSRDQVIAAVALLKLNVTPVVILSFRAGGDSHRDSDLGLEVTETIERLDAIQFLWTRLQMEGLADRVTFANLDVFGRKLIRNASGGRDHNGSHHAMMMFGPRIQPGVVGGLAPTMRGGRVIDFAATAIGDIPFDETLQSAGKTLATAIGIPDDRIEARMVGGQVVRDILV
ncbi:MAG: DUF1501 domain-containing protein [Sandaracinaceae bacterium]